MDIHISSNNRELQHLHLAARTASKHYLWSVSEELEGVYLALKRGDCHFRVQAYLMPSGVWAAEIEPGHVPEPIESIYEIYAVERDRPIFLGRGKLSVEESACSGDAIESVQGATMMPLYDDDGLMHTVKVVQLDNGQYTLEVK